MTTRHTGCRFARHVENIPRVSMDGGCRCCRIETIRLQSNDSSQKNDDPSYRMSICKTLQIDIRYDGSSFAMFSFDSSPTVSNRQHLLRCIVYNILTIDFRSFHALKTWKVHVVMFLYHATHFHLLLTCTCAPLDFRYVNARFDF